MDEWCMLCFLAGVTHNNKKQKRRSIGKVLCVNVATGLGVINYFTMMVVDLIKGVGNIQCIMTDNTPFNIGHRIWWRTDNII